MLTLARQCSLAGNRAFRQASTEVRRLAQSYALLRGKPAIEVLDLFGTTVAVVKNQLVNRVTVARCLTTRLAKFVFAVGLTKNHDNWQVAVAV